MFKNSSYVLLTSLAACMVILQTAQAMNVEDVLQNSESVLSHKNLDPADWEVYLNKLSGMKWYLQEEIERHRTQFTKHVPNRHALKKKIKNSPQKKHSYRCGVHLLKELAKVEKEIAFALDSRPEKTVIEDSNFLNNSQTDLKLFYQKSAESLTHALNKKNSTRIKHPWLLGWMAFSITWQSLVIPACAHPQQANYNTKIAPEKYTCPSIPMNGTQAVTFNQSSPAILKAPVFEQLQPQFVYPIPYVAANAKAIDDITRCFWEEKSVQKKGQSYDCLVDTFLNQIPDYGNLEVWDEWYDDIRFLPGSRSKLVFTAVTKQPRKNLPPYTKIIILGEGPMLKKLAYRAISLTNYCRALSVLSNFKGKPIVGYYAEVFSTYFGGEPFILKGKWPISHDKRMLYTEMEYIDEAFSFIGVDEQFSDHIPDNIVFEKDLGEWASTTIAKVSHGEGCARHNLIAKVGYYRAYHIGKDIYLFAPGLMPKLIDFDTLNIIDDNYSGLYRSKFKYDSNKQAYKLSPDAKKVVDEMGEKGIFTVFSHYFAKYKVSEKNPMPSLNVKHFYIPEEYLDNM